MKTKHTKATVAEPPKRQLQNTPINRAFLFLYRGVMQGSVKVPTITDMSDDNAENYPMISGEEYMRKAMDAQIEHEAKPSNAELVAALEGCVELVGDFIDSFRAQLSPAALAGLKAKLLPARAALEKAGRGVEGGGE